MNTATPLARDYQRLRALFMSQGEWDLEREKSIATFAAAHPEMSRAINEAISECIIRQHILQNGEIGREHRLYKIVAVTTNNEDTTGFWRCRVLIEDAENKRRHLLSFIRRDGRATSVSGGIDVKAAWEMAYIKIALFGKEFDKHTLSEAIGRKIVLLSIDGVPTFLPPDNDDFKNRLQKEGRA